MTKLQGSILVFIGASSFGLLSTFVKLAYAEGFTQGQVSGLQAIFGVMVLGVMSLLQCKKPIPKNQKNLKLTPTWKVILAGASTGFVSVTYYYCIQLVPASLAIILLMQFVWISMLIEAIIFHKKPTRIQLIAAIIVLIGTYFASGLFTSSINQLPLKGIAFGLAAAVAYSLFLIINGRVGNDLHPLKKSLLMMIGSCILVLIIFPPTFLFSGFIAKSLIKWGMLLAIFGTVIPPLLYAYGIPKAGVNLSAILSSAELPVAVCMSFFILHETIDVWRWLGVAIILTAIILPNIIKRKEK